MGVVFGVNESTLEPSPVIVTLIPYFSNKN
jgi:hypothetical protein